MVATARSLARLAPGAARGGAGTLWVVGSPIGNLRDLPPRTARLLRRAPVVAAESVHTAEALLRGCGASRAAAGAAPRVVSYHAHNEAERAPELLEALRAGEDVALLPRAGTPLLRDPGRVLVAAAHARGLAVRALPGPSSLTAALSVSGLAGDRLLFDGYLPALREARRRRLRELRAAGAAAGAGGEAATLAFFSDGAAVDEALADLAEAFGAQARACVAKELTMPHEWVRLSELGALRGDWGGLPRESKRGAAVLLVEPPCAARGGEGAPPPPPPPPLGGAHGGTAAAGSEASDVARILLRGGVRPQQAALLVAQLTGAALAIAQRAVEREALGAAAGANAADALPAGAEGGGSARHTLHLVNLGPSLTTEELSTALAGLGAPYSDLSLTDNLNGERIAFARFATPEAASEARARINVAGITLGAGRPVLAGWARRERWLS